jgi:hypothetical protein
MRTIYANEIWHGDKEVVRGFIVVPKTIEESIRTLFSDTTQGFIPALIHHEKTKIEGGFHFFTRFCQFVVFFNYDDKEVVINGKLMKMGISIEVMYFGTSDNPNDVFDYMLKLRQSGWGEDSRDKILEIAYQIKKDQHESHFEIAELKIKDPYNDFSSFL